MRLGARIAVMLFSVAILQRGVFSQIHVAGVAFDVLLLMAIAAGMTIGPERGAIVGFFAGLTFDLFVETPLGLSALTYLVTAYLAARIQQAVIHAGWWVPMFIAAVASAIAEGLFMVTGAVLGQPVPSPHRVLAIVLVVSLFNAVAIRPACRFMRWAWNAPDVRPALY